MNERIKQLAEQADWWKPLDLPSNWDEGDYVVSPEQMKKFAELIVQECAKVVDIWSDEVPPSEGYDKLTVGKLKEHFGVKE